MHTELAILGGGPGGYAAAFLAADLGMQATIIDQSPSLGGTCLLRGCIPSKALLHAARVISESREMADWGIDFGQPKIDIDALRARKDKIISTLTGGLAALAKKRNVNILRARGVFEHSTRLRLEAEDGVSLEYNALTFDHMIVAAGSRPAIPGIFQLSDRVMDSSGALQLRDIPETLLIVGGGYIGLEMGTVYAQLGSKVTVVEMLDDLLPGADRDLVRPLKKRLMNLFENIHLKTKVASLTDTGSAVEAALEGEAFTGTQTFDRALISIGRRPNSDRLGLDTTKVQLDEQGFIQVDAQMRTADKRICAIGDIVGNPMLAHKASREAKVAVEVIKGEPSAFSPQAIPAVIFTDPEIAWAGLTEEQAKIDGIKYEVAAYPWAASGRAQALGRTEGLTKLLIEPDSQRILGAGLVGVGAGELIGEAVLAIEMGCEVRDIAESIHPHPTMSETYPNASEVFFGLATEIYKPKRKKK